MSRNHARTMRNFYAVYGYGPWKCHWCECDVHHIGRGTWLGQVHHLDHDETNDDPANLVIGHCICHMRDHHAGVPKTAEHNAKVSAAHRGREIVWADKIQESRRAGGLYEKVSCSRCGRPIAGGVGNMRQHQRGRSCVTVS